METLGLTPITSNSSMSSFRVVVRKYLQSKSAHDTHICRVDASWEFSVFLTVLVRKVSPRDASNNVSIDDESMENVQLFLLDKEGAPHAIVTSVDDLQNGDHLFVKLPEQSGNSHTTVDMKEEDPRVSDSPATPSRRLVFSTTSSANERDHSSDPSPVLGIADDANANHNKVATNLTTTPKSCKTTRKGRRTHVILWMLGYLEWQKEQAWQRIAHSKLFPTKFH